MLCFDLVLLAFFTLSFSPTVTGRYIDDKLDLDPGLMLLPQSVQSQSLSNSNYPDLVEDDVLKLSYQQEWDETEGECFLKVRPRTKDAAPSESDFESQVIDETDLNF